MSLFAFRIKLAWDLKRRGMSWTAVWWHARPAVPGCAADDWRRWAR